MCVIFFAFKQHSEYPLVLLANRDEFYERPTAAAHFWQDAPDIYAGRDLVHGGTWLGITKSGRFAAVTNYRDPNALKGKFSRGDLVSDFLKTNETVEDYLQKTQKSAAQFSGFNLLVGEFNPQIQTLGYYSNREDKVRILAPGIYGLSNHLLDTPWRKVRTGKAALTEVLQNGALEKDGFFQILNDKTLAGDADLPDTGIGLEREKLLSAIFIETLVYGTRSSSVVVVNKDYEISLDERNFH
jgi:uncharacterized protein with NRDE domain